jgi:positive regulator of sigma E activity
MYKRKVFQAGKVIEVGDKKIKVELFSQELPSACTAKGCSACKSYLPQTTREYPKSDFVCEVFADDIVKVESWQINDGTAAVAVFMIPILFFAVFYYISTILGAPAESIVSIIFAIFGGIFGFGITVAFEKIFCKFNPTKIFRE